ncbi:beta-galactosidase [Enterococcus sp. JM4C]|uniref:beta-galactosidase n=1 Tax=Candidatus Enterococcus huntleyi TaxID=1857217 RepID=UPI00137A77F5|nr:beta-galactosidase [Enterococcus sp. JM4C]KAF1299400.1 beta-galactosidase [Enterococcus sp. JM4C]
MIQTKLPKILFGGDYCPEQWDDETIDRDIRLMKQAHVNCVVLSVFTWALIEPSEGEYHFEWLDKVLDKLYNNGIYVCLATPTSAQPAWLSKKYPEVMPVDRAGRKRNHGMRVFFCVNSDKYRERAALLTEQMANRYADFPGLLAWHVANEYGTYCYCDHCQEKFREWLKDKYGSIEKLNDKWTTVFWGRQVYDFDEIMIPSELNDDYRFNPAVQLDYLRFVTSSTKDCFLNEANILKQKTPRVPVYTNISGHIKNIDQYELTSVMDFVGWDNYPTPREELSNVAMKLDLMRSLKNGDSFLIAEQSPNQQNWQPYNKIKRPGEVKTIAYQGLARGGDGCFFFQMKQSIGGQEKFHGALIGHSGKGDTRTFKEMSELGEELERIGSRLLDGKTTSEVAIYFDWDSWWDLDNASGPSKDIHYFEIVNQYYKALYDRNIAVDIVKVDSDISKYKLVIAPSLYIVPDETAENISRFVQQGGCFIGTIRTGVVDENDRCVYGLAPGLLQDVLGIEVEEMDALFPDEQNELVLSEELTLKEKQTKVNLLCELINLKGAESLATYKKDFYAGKPCITRNVYGDGKAYYIGSSLETEFIANFLADICGKMAITSYEQEEQNIEIIKRSTANEQFYFVINHNDFTCSVDLYEIEGINLLKDEKVKNKTVLQAREVLIVKQI